MNLKQRIRLLNRLHSLIRSKAAGTPDACAHRLDTGRSALYRYLDELQSFGASVKDCKQRESSVYEEDFTLNFEKFC